MNCQDPRCWHGAKWHPAGGACTYAARGKPCPCDRLYLIFECPTPGCFGCVGVTARLHAGGLTKCQRCGVDVADPLNYACPTCDALPGAVCRSKRMHVARRRIVVFGPRSRDETLNLV